jgi:hypothetical protein
MFDPYFEDKLKVCEFNYFLEILPNIEKLKIYEYYDGLEISYKLILQEEIQHMLILQEEIEILSFPNIFDYLENANNLVEFNYQSRFASELNLKNAKTTLKLKTLIVNTIQDIKPENLQGLDKLIINIQGDSVTGQFNINNINLPYLDYEVIVINSEDLLLEEKDKLIKIFDDKVSFE